jgi:hypothetical protein
MPCLVLTGLFLLGGGTAAADVEPANETPVGAEGSLSAGVTYTGKMGAATDEADWYFFYAQPGVELTIKSSASGCEPHNFDMELFGRDAAAGSSDGRKAWAATINYRTPPGGAPQLYYLRLHCHPGWKSSGAAYTFKITSTSAAALVPGEREFGTTQAVIEPNEFREQASGPLVGGVTYAGVTATSNDQDWFYFYAKPLQEIEIAATTADLSCDEDSDGFIELEAEGAEPYSGTSAWIYAGGINRIRHTTASAYKRYYVSVGCPLSSYLFRITPASALASQACVDAVAARDGLAVQLSQLRKSRQTVKRSHVSRVRALTRRKRHARTPAAKRRIARALKRSKRQNRHRLGALARDIKASEAAGRQQAAAAGQACA